MLTGLDHETATLLAVVFAMAANQLVMRVSGLKGRRTVFWGLQLLNIIIGTMVIMLGLPGLPRIISWFIALLFFFRTVVNNNGRLRWLEENKRDQEDDDVAKRAALREALRRGE